MITTRATRAVEPDIPEGFKPQIGDIAKGKRVRYLPSGIPNRSTTSRMIYVACERCGKER